MKIRNGFVSNSSSSSFIVCGFSTDDSCEAYNILEKKLKEEDPTIDEDDMSWSIYCYLKERGINYLNHGEWNDTEEIGCILEEGSGKEFNESLQVPKQVAAEINSILDRITKFEANINGLGENIAHTQMVGSALVEQIKENISAIRSKQKVAENYSDTASKKLEIYFEEQKKEMGRVMQKYNEALDSYLDDYEKMLQERKKELEQRKREFVEAIDKKLSVDEIRSEFSSLKKLNDISQMLEQLMRNPVDGNQLMRTLSKIHTELNAISAIQEDNKKGGWFSNNSNTAVDRAQREKEEANRKAEEAEREKQKIIELARIQAEKDRAEKEALLAKIREEQERDQKAMEVIQRVQQKDSPVYESVNNESISRSQIDTSLEEHPKVSVAEDVPTAAPISMDKGIDGEEKSNKKRWFRKLFGIK